MAATPARSGPPVAATGTAALAPATTTRALFDTGSGGTVEAAVFDRPELSPGAGAAGPALVVERETTAVVPPGRVVRVLGDGTLDIRAEGGSDAE